VRAQPCLMVAATPEDASAPGDGAVLQLSETPAGAVHSQPCLMVYVPQQDAGPSLDASSAAATGAPTLPTGPHAVAAPCLSMAATSDAGAPRPQVCLRIAPPRTDAGTTARDASVRAPRPVPCLEVAVPTPCLTPVRKDD
jgi:hypothetical protein